MKIYDGHNTRIDSPVRVLILLGIILAGFTGLMATDRMMSAHRAQDSLFHEDRTPLIYTPSKGSWTPVESITGRQLQKTVFGYLPYWERSTSPDFFRYDLLSHLAVFSWGVSSSGYLSQPAGWPGEWAEIVLRARESGVRLIACITEFNDDEMHAIIGSPSARLTFIDQLSGLIENYSLHGVNLDFEAPYTSDRGAPMNGLVAQVRDSLHSRFGPACEVSFAAPVINWSDHWDLRGLAAACDQVFIMGYAFWGSWSSTAGPNSPLVSTGISITSSLDEDYAPALAEYPGRIILGVPYYGHRWTTVDNSEGSAVISGGTSVFYASAADRYAVSGSNWSVKYRVPWTAWQEGGWQQIWCDDPRSLNLKYELAMDRGLGGVGMWALAYDDPKKDLWIALAENFYKTVSDTLLAGFFDSRDGFITAPNYSGSSRGISSASFLELNAQEQVLDMVLIDNPNSSDPWTVRLLTGKGRPYMNAGFDSRGRISVSLACPPELSGSVSLLIDDIQDGTEKSAEIDLVNDGRMHSYQWYLEDEMESFALGNGRADGPVITLDALYFRFDNEADTALVRIDDVMFTSAVSALEPGEGNAGSPQTFRFISAYPNPFNTDVTLSYNIPYSGAIHCEIFDLLGRRVFRQEFTGQAAGLSEVHLKMTDRASGVYLLRSTLTSPGKQHITLPARKITLVK